LIEDFDFLIACFIKKHDDAEKEKLDTENVELDISS